jgi:hypothetical protein
VSPTALVQPGLIPKAALALWIPFALMLFAVLRPQLAALIAIVGGIMFLPEIAVLEIPGVPPLDKEEIASLAALLGCLWRCPSALRKARPGRGADLFVVLLIASSFVTMLNNSEPVPTPASSEPLPGINLHDVISLAIKDLLKIGVPFLVGRAVLKTSRDLRDLLLVYAGGALAYTPLIPIEIRLSPQFHNWIYGYHPHFLDTAMRSGGGFRPMLFMGGGGLGVALFMAEASIASFGLMKAKRSILSLPSSVVAPFLLGLLIIIRSVASIIYALFAAPIVWLTSPKTQVRIATILTSIVLVYPLLRISEVLPTEKLVDMATSISVERADSLKFRFDQEALLITRAREKFLFGWGGYNRGMLYDEWGHVTITDGHWIITLGTRGIVGFILTFGLLAYPIFVLRKKLKSIREKPDRTMIGALALMLTVHMVDLLPNGLFSELPFLVTGALFGLSRSLSKAQPSVAPVQARPTYAPPRDMGEDPTLRDGQPLSPRRRA